MRHNLLEGVWRLVAAAACVASSRVPDTREFLRRMALAHPAAALPAGAGAPPATCVSQVPGLSHGAAFVPPAAAVATLRTAKP